MKTGIKRPSWKRIVLISSITVAVAAVIVYVAISIQAWNTASSTTLEASTNLKQSVDTKLATETAPTSIPIAVDEILKSYNDTISKGPCQLPAFFEWQSSLPWLKDVRQTCLNTAQSTDALAKSLTTMQAFYKQDNAAALLLKQATDSMADSKDYTASALNWQKVAEDTSLMSEGAFAPVGASIIEVTHAISSAYTALAAAHTKEDKAAFDTAKQALTEAYARLAEVKTASSEAQGTLVDAVVKAYGNV